MKTQSKQCIQWVVTICFVALWFASGNLYAQTKCSNKLLDDIYNQLKENYIKEDVSGEITIPTLCKSRPIVIETPPQGVINHIGIKLFDRAVIEKHPSLLYPFVERYLLELLMMSNHQDIMTKMKMERVKISSAIYPTLAVKEGIQKICADFSSNLSFSIICRNNRYIFSCMDNHRDLMVMSFPVRHELITGYSKLEAERSFYPDLLMYKETEYTPLNEAELFPYKDSLYSFNEDYYLTEDIISTSYYHKVDNTIVPVFSSDRLVESVYNLFNTGYDWGVEAEVTQSMYGGKNLTFNVPLSKLARFLNEQNCLVYTGIQKYDKTTISGSLMAVNMELGYQHLMMFSFPRDLIDHPKEHQVKIKMYSFIPIHNISSLFDNNSKIK
ncbi:MAG: hypothetical protein IJZ38_13090 [Bacteroides sp.]|nr:hypothetical protein [Bacteroides sp.]